MTTDLARAEPKSDNPVPLEFPLNKCALTIREKCGACLHFKRMAYPAYKKVCIEKGIIEESKPCKAFQADLSKIKFTERKHVNNVAKLMQELSAEELKLLASVLNGEERTRRYNFQFGQVLYFRAFGGDFISNYLRAFVLYADSKYVHLQGTDGCSISLFHGSVMNERQWQRKCATLLKTNKQKDPSLLKYTRTMTKRERDFQNVLDETIPALTAESKLEVASVATNPKTKNTRIMRLDQILVMR